MVEKLKKKGFKTCLRLGILAAVVVYAVITVIAQQATMNDQAAKKAELLAEQAELSSTVTLLERKMEYIHSDSYAEQAVREKLGWVKDGEIIFRIDENADAEGNE